MPGTTVSLAISPVNTPVVAAAPAPTDPPVENDLILWLDAAATIYTDSGGTSPATANGHRIALWRDRSVNLWDLTPPTPDESPELFTAFGGIRSVFFGLDPDSGTNRTSLLNEDFGANGEAEWSFALLFIPGSTAAYSRRIVSQTIGDKMIQVMPTEQLQVLNDQGELTDVNMETTTILTLNEPVIVTGRMSASLGYTLRLNNIEEDSDANTPTAVWGGIYLGHPVNAANVYVSELLLWNVGLTNAQLTEAYQYLRNKHDL